MPLLRVQTNVEVDTNVRRSFLAEATGAVAEMLGKSQQYVMVVLSAGEAMMLAGDPGPAAFAELRSIGLDERRTGDLSSTLCALMETHLAVPPHRVFINFTTVPRHLWGWNGKTF